LFSRPNNFQMLHGVNEDARSVVSREDT